MSAQQRTNEGHYFIVVDGVPPHCQWQELKDYIRESVKVNPAGYADVLRVNEDGTRVGYCGLRSKADANKAFEFLVAEGWRGLNIRVTIAWKADLRSEAIERKRGPEASLRKRNTNTTPALPSFPSNVPGPMRSITKPPPNAYNLHSLHHALPTQTPLSYPVRLSAQTCARSYQSLPQTRSLAQPACKAVDVPECVLNFLPIPTGPPLQSSLLLNREDRIYTDQLAIHMSRLPFDIKPSDLKALLSQFGTVSDISIKRGKEKRCSATAKFAYPSEAARAIQALHGKRWNKLSLVVRLDRSEVGSTSSAPSTISKGSDDSDSSSPRLATAEPPIHPRQGPLVVDGACGPGYHRRKTHAKDLEARLDSSDDEDALLSRKKATQKSTRKTSSRVASR